MTTPPTPSVSNADNSKKVCPHCGHTNQMSAKNCTQCGTAFFLISENGQMRKRCSQCGFYNRDQAKMCTRCGEEYRVLRIASRGQVQKWCSQCGAPRRLHAKVCTRCGFRFVQRVSEPPIEQSTVLAEPISTQLNASAPAPGAPRPDFDLSGDPAPYLSQQEFEQVRLEGRSRWEFIRRVIDGFLGGSD